MIKDKVSAKIKKYNLIIQYLPYKKIMANAVIIKSEDKNYIFISDCLPDRIIYLVFFHEIAHIETNTIGEKYLKYNKYIEMKNNIKAILNFKSMLSWYIIIYYIILAILSEKILYKNFNKNNRIELEGELWKKKYID